MKYFMLRKKEYHREAIAGSKNEHSLADTIYEYFKQFCDWVEKIDTPLDTWEELECSISYGDKSIVCKSMPFTLSGEVVGEPVFGEYFNGRIIVNGQVRDNIVFIPFPEDPDDSKYVVLKLYEYGASAVVFYDQLPGRYRRMVIIGDEDYSFRHGAPSPIPVVSIMKEDFLRIYKDKPTRIMLKSKTRIKHGVIGYSVMCGVNGRGEEEIHVTAHHDHWFSGFSDNMVGVELLLQAASILRKNWDGVNLVFISYTAEESGSPYYTSWYWTWGSRYYLGILRKKNLLEKIIADINVDAIYTYPLHINGNPALMKCINKLVENGEATYDGYDYTDFDSYSYTLNGIPALTLHTLKEMKHIYHTNLDNGSEVYDYTIARALNTLINTIKCVNNNKPKYKYLIEYIRGKAGEKLPLEGRVLISKLENMDKIISDERKLLSIITSRFSTVIYIPAIDGLFSSDILADIFEIMNRIEDISKYIGRRIRVKVVDREQFLDISPTKNNIEELVKSLRYALTRRIEYYDELLKEVISKYIS
jgi:Iap family predicted aminopeptidase